MSRDDDCCLSTLGDLQHVFPEAEITQFHVSTLWINYSSFFSYLILADQLQKLWKYIDLSEPHIPLAVWTLGDGDMCAICVCVHASACASICVCVCVCTCGCVCASVCICMYVCVCVHASVSMCVCACVDMHVCVAV